ncbi:MAG: lmo0937 family membrane protein [Bacteroidia bacterium]
MCFYCRCNANTGGLIHILLVIALISVLLGVIQGRRAK